MLLEVAAPWSLSHYIPLNGFDPLYRALFDYAPRNITLCAWDNVKLHRYFESNPEGRSRALDLAASERRRLQRLPEQSIERAYGEYFWAPNKVLTEALPGDIEFHHTAPFPSLRRPFVFHCESFAPIFLPFSQQTNGKFERQQELRAHYSKIFANPQCLGIFSHVHETLERLSQFFSDPAIDKKLFSSRMGLGREGVDAPVVSSRLRTNPRFLFVGSADQNPADFFLRGGHIALRFWKEFLSAGRNGKLILQCSRPSDEVLRPQGVDTSFVERESGSSILWIAETLSGREIETLIANADFLLLPSMSLHSVPILLAMTFGTVPVITDTPGAENYVSDGNSGIVLTGVRHRVRYGGTNRDLLLDQCHQSANVEATLTKQIIQRVLSVLDSPQAYSLLSRRARETVSREFSGKAFAEHFWQAVGERYESYKAENKTIRRSAAFGGDLSGALLSPPHQARAFESAPQPVKRIYSGIATVSELGGAIVHASGKPQMRLEYWSVLSRYLLPSAPALTFANDLVELDSSYIFASNVANGYERNRFRRSRFRQFASRLLMPFPELHSAGAQAYKAVRKYYAS